MFYRFCIWTKTGKLLPKAFWSFYWHCSCSSKPKIQSGYMALNFWCADFRLALFWEGCLLCNFWDKTYADKPFWKMYSVVEWSVNIHFVAGYGTNFCIKTKFLFKFSVSGSIHTLTHWMLNERLIWKQMINLHKFSLILHCHPTFPTKSFLRFYGCLFKNISIQNVAISCWMEKVFRSSFLVTVVTIPSMYH